MKIYPAIIASFFISLCYGQTTKTLNDSIFQKRDIIKIPQIVYGLSKPCCWGSQFDSIKPLVDFLNKHSELFVELSVHTDSRGGNEMNKILSDFRAKTVWETLIYKYKLDSTRITYKGYGESKLLINDMEIMKVKTEEEKHKLHAVNRRTELLVLDVN